MEPAVRGAGGRVGDEGEVCCGGSLHRAVCACAFLWEGRKWGLDDFRFPHGWQHVGWGLAFQAVDTSRVGIFHS